MRKDQRGLNAMGRLNFRMWCRWWKSEDVDVPASPLCSGGCWVILSFTHAPVRVSRSGGTVSTSDNHKPDAEQHVFREEKIEPVVLLSLFPFFNNLLKSDNLISQCAFYHFHSLAETLNVLVLQQIKSCVGELIIIPSIYCSINRNTTVYCSWRWWETRYLF